MRIAVYGSGGVGGYFGGRLAESGEAVVFIARGAHLAAIQADGLRITSPQGDFAVHPATAVADPAEAGPADLILVGVKAWQVPAAAEALRPMVRPDTVLLPLQNGIEAPGQLAAVLGSDHVLGGLCRIIASIAGPGRIHHTGGEPYVAVGALDPGPRHRERAAEVAGLFARARGVRAEAVPDIRTGMWNKFMFIAALSGVGALTGSTVGELRSRADHRELLVEALREVHRLALAEGVRLPEGSVAEALALVDALPAEGTTSMQRDLAAGRPSELEAQSGAVVRMAERIGLAVPVHRRICDALRPRERMARMPTG